ncbi:parathyroid hormone/parathyroid hormone-related peptide receptor-like isoform X2 [Atheta coriaria]|uniref:parathyroid hormone/parathyroid hormone-related peptide receptor-like isoform X2 n=1 Tax=Dalotia coriaria TaxID=877792 RepID=UPI0031F3D8C4
MAQPNTNLLYLFLQIQNATKFCEPDGSWYNWTNYQDCMPSNTTVVSIDINKSHSLDNLKAYVPTINIISRTGYSISFFTLVLAFFIMLSIKKLHCARNKLHMHLFASFIMRAGMRLLKDLLFADGILNSLTKLIDGNKYIVDDKKNSNWRCKLFLSLFNFFITANYSWILMEGLYLYNLIFRSMFADSHTKITQYIILGWGMPFLVVAAWATARILMEDTYCWTTHDQDKMTFWIIRIPTAVSIMLNLYLFVRIALVIYMKLQPPNQEEARSYRKWARSTLVLAPLFGIHYAVLIGMSSSSNETVEIIWLFADQLFASFNGFVVAILYCFLNSEVRAELKPHIHAFLVFIASHNCLKYFFPCRERYLRSARGRTSVCTTMSCSSLFNNVVNPRNSRAGLRGDQALRNKNGIKNMSAIRMQDTSKMIIKHDILEARRSSSLQSDRTDQSIKIKDLGV